MSKYAFLRTRLSFAILGLVLGLVGGFKLANSQYRSEQNKALSANISKTLAQLPSAGAAAGPAGDAPTGETQAIMERARANPNDAEAQMEAASQFIQIERAAEAMPFLERADKAKPNDPRIMASLGVAHFMLGNLDEAAGWLKRSREQGAKEPTVTSLLIGAYIQTGKNLDEADRLLKELEERGIDPAKLARIREDLVAARKGKLNPAPAASTGAPPAPGGGKTMLQHGPENSGGKN
ncbi:MAG: tetratricopeptide repeat protein [Blastocatellia bacterium]|nr:tetratricopeptide repeat protein [Blastocatellia bacterium]